MLLVAESATTTREEWFPEFFFEISKGILPDEIEDVNLATKVKNITGLAFAIRLHKYEVAERLLDMGANPNITDEIGTTALHEACGENVPGEMIRKLLAHGANVSTFNTYGVSPIVTSVHNCNIEIVKILLDAGADINAKVQDGSTLLILACCLNDYAIVKLLLERGADINAQNRQGMNALLVASHKGFYPIVKLLLDYSPDLSALDSDGDSALEIALIEDRFDIAELLLTTGMKRPQSIFYVVYSDQWSLIQYYSDVNVRDVSNNTPLMYAACLGHLKTIEILLASGAKIDERNDQNLTAYQMAVNKGHEDAAKYLHSHSMKNTN